MHVMYAPKNRLKCAQNIREKKTKMCCVFEWVCMFVSINFDFEKEHSTTTVTTTSKQTKMKEKKYGAVRLKGQTDNCQCRNELPRLSRSVFSE